MIKLSKLIQTVLFIGLWTSLQAQEIKPNLPWIDISNEKEKQIVIAKGTEELYNGHPTTVMMEDNQTIFCTWSYKHGGKCGLMAVSRDGGKTCEQV